MVHLRATLLYWRWIEMFPLQGPSVPSVLVTWTYQLILGTRSPGRALQCRPNQFIKVFASGFGLVGDGTNKPSKSLEYVWLGRFLIIYYTRISIYFYRHSGRNTSETSLLLQKWKIFQCVVLFGNIENMMWSMTIRSVHLEKER